MPCNCGKSRPQGPASSKPLPQGSGSGAGAGTGKAASTSTTFELRSNTGRTMTFGSRLEAQAARVRAGGGVITPR